LGDILDQNEVDALLAAVEGGEIELPVGEAAAPTARAPRLGRAPSAYDFKRPEPLSKDHMRALEVVHEVFARNLGAVLSGRLRSIVEVRMQTVEQLTYSEFILSLPNPTCFCIVAAEPLVGSLILELSPNIVFPLMELLLGASQPSPTPPDRALTDLEVPIVRDIVARALEEMEKLWTPIQALKFSLIGMEANPQLVQLQAANEPVALITFQVSASDHHGRLNICIPFVTMEPLVSRLAAHVGFGKEEREIEPTQRKAVEVALGRVTVEVRSVLVESTIRIRELMDLAVGDVLATDRPSDAPSTLLVGDRPKFLVRPGIVRGHRAVQVLGPCGPNDPTN